MKDEAAPRMTLKVVEVAKLLGIGKNEAYAAVRAGVIPCIRVGGRYLIPKPAMERWLLDAGRQDGGRSAANDHGRPSGAGEAWIPSACR